MSNSEFQDRFFQGINFQLSKLLFIFSYNSTENIDKILLDRIDEIKVGAFKFNDKKLVVRQFIIKEMCDMICLDCNMVVFDDKIIEFIVENYTNEPGIRQLKLGHPSIVHHVSGDLYIALRDGPDEVYKKPLYKRNIGLGD